jgi:hypothetical protein
MTTQLKNVAGENVLFGKLPLAYAVGAGIGIVLNLIVFFVAPSVIGVPLNIPTPPTNEIGPLPFIAVMMATLIGTLGGVLVLAALGRFTPRPFTIFFVVSAVFLVVSFGGPLGLPVAAGIQWTLNVMHIIAGAGIVGALALMARA